MSAHVVASVGWLGVHGGVLALAATGLAAESSGAAADAYAGAAQLVRLLVLPLSLTALVTGLVLALGTPWGLFRHYWVALKLGFTALLVAGSNLSLGPMVLDLAAATAGGAVLPPGPDRAQPVVALSVALTLLLASTLLSTVKPFGRIRRPATEG
ncbi:hypothetical protein ACFO4E_00575 [Nocardiopsis mangrovi]|uniref:DUF2269 domain-containing protein n=1 Tax=Nocardiopsis mangrovi TaxID=1179818 RepID=A0ABV9DNY4_9ACTN